jgi:hypothetical protein
MQIRPIATGKIRNYKEKQGKKFPDLFTKENPAEVIPPGLRKQLELLFHDVGGRRSLWPVNNFELNLVALIECLETRSTDGRVVDKNILACFLLNKTETFRLVKPLHCSFQHRSLVLLVLG